MAKTIKFNLILDGKPIRTKEALSENFCIEDVIQYYQNGILQKWLEVRGYEDELNQVRSITETVPVDVIKRLARIFELDCDEEKLEKGLDVYLQKEYVDKLIEGRKGIGNVYFEAIDEYHKKFDGLIKKVLTQPTNKELIKKCIKEMVEYYPRLFRAEYERIINLFAKRAKLALFVMLTFDEVRNLLFKGESYQSNFESERKERCKKIIKGIFPESQEQRSEILQKYRCFVLKKINTEKKWETIVAADRKILLVYCDMPSSWGTGTLIKEADDVLRNSKGYKEYCEEKYEFPVFKGLDVNNSCTNDFIYMEV